MSAEWSILPTRRIAVVDDDPAMRRLMTQALEGSGYEVRAFGDGRTALGHIPAHPPDLIILDMTMGDFGAESVLKGLKAHPGASQIPVLLCTVHGIDTVRRKLSAKPRHILYKPFHIEDLLKAVGRALAEAQ